MKKSIDVKLLAAICLAYLCGESFAQAVDPDLGTNTAPEAIAQSVAIIKNKAQQFTLIGRDTENDALSFEVLTQPSQGEITGTAPNLTYVPKGDYTGNDEFSFKVNDGSKDSQPAKVSITVAPSPGRVLKGWWGNFNTNDYNPINSSAFIKGKPNFDYIDPDSIDAPYPPTKETYIDASGRELMSWVLRRNRPIDPLQQAGGVGGGNRTVHWKKTTSSSPYKQVWGYFSEPDISRVNFERKSNKPTYYFGIIGSLDGSYIASDSGIQWEPANGQAPEGWSFINRFTTALGVQNGRWDIFKQLRKSDEPYSRRFAKGSLGTVRMGYTIDDNNVGTISMSNGSNLAVQFGDPKKEVILTSLRRNVGLTQGVTAEEIAANDPNIAKFSTALVYLDGSIVRNLKFGGGELKTAPKLSATDPAEQTDSWQTAGGYGELKPPEKADDKFIVDFVQIAGNDIMKPRTSLTDDKNANFNTENVTITMGTATKAHKVERLPKGRKK